MSRLSCLVLSAGEGTRMKSALPKVLHEAAGQPLLLHVLESIRRGIPSAKVGIVLGRDSEKVQRSIHHWGYKEARTFIQAVRKGSGDAVRRAQRWFGTGAQDIVVLCGDVPLIRPETIRRFVGYHRKSGNAGTVLSAKVPDPTGYGRILRDDFDKVLGIVEEKDATEEQKSIKEINTGIYCFRVKKLLPALRRLKPNNAKREYYITDVISDFAGNGAGVGAVLASSEEAMGVNDRQELAQVDAILRRRILSKWMREGVTIVDPHNTYVDSRVRIGRDTILFPGTVLSGETRIGEGCRIGPFCSIEDCWIGKKVVIRASFLRKSQVGEGSLLGPFVQLRPGSRVGKSASIGNFTELKNSRVGDFSKVNHLSYIGDADLAHRVNVGAGTITCNYDGFAKHRTKVGARVFIGSNVNLVAPVKIGEGAVLGAGSTVDKDVPKDALAIERASLFIKPGWAKERRLKQQTGKSKKRLKK